MLQIALNVDKFERIIFDSPSPLPTGRQPCRKTTLQEDELKRGQTQRKTSKQENNLTVRQEDDFSLPS